MSLFVILLFISCTELVPLLQSMDRKHPESHEPQSPDSEAHTPGSQTPEVQDPSHKSGVQSHEAQDPEAQDPEAQNPAQKSDQTHEAQDPRTQDPEAQEPEPQRHEEMERRVHGREETGMEIAVEEHRLVWLWYAQSERNLEISVLLTNMNHMLDLRKES